MTDARYPQRGKSRLRTGRSTEPGRIYLVTFNTAYRQPIFHDWSAASTAAAILHSRHLWRGSRLLCWVLMPDHWHGLIELGDMDTLSALVGRIKGAMARSVNIATSRQGALWDTGFHDHGIHCDEDVVDIARYIVCNPLRASLVDRMGDYPFWDAVWITEGHHG